MSAGDSYFNTYILPIQKKHLAQHLDSLSAVWSWRGHKNWVSVNDMYDPNRSAGSGNRLADISQELTLDLMDLSILRHAETYSQRAKTHSADLEAERYIMAQCLMVLGAQVALIDKAEQLLKQPPSPQLYQKLRGALPANIRTRLQGILGAKNHQQLIEQRDLTVRYCDKLSYVTLFCDSQTKAFFADPATQEKRLKEYEVYVEIASHLTVQDLNANMRTHLSLGRRLAKSYMASLQQDRHNKARRLKKSSKGKKPQP